MNKYIPMEIQLIETIIDLVNAIDLVSEKLFVIQPFLSVFVKHAATFRYIDDVYKNNTNSVSVKLRNGIVNTEKITILLKDILDKELEFKALNGVEPGSIKDRIVDMLNELEMKK